MYNPPETLRQISSRLTFITKFISPVMSLAVAVYIFVILLRSPVRSDLSGTGIFLGVLTAITGYHLWTAYRIKSVKADSKNLYISNYFKETSIPLNQIANVTEFRWAEPRVVTIHLRSPSEFDQKIAFLAPYRFFGWYSPHPIVAELQQMAEFETYKEIKDTWLS